jgi:HlyD family type I secretion membrane fusion protein
VRNQYLQQAADELKDNLARLKETQERLKPSEDMVDRQLVRSPVDGEVMSLRVGATGTAVAPREPLLDVVPAKEKLVVEARIKPTDIDYVRAGGAADIRLTAFEYRRTPVLSGQVLAVSADRVEDQRSGASWFVATVEVDATKLRETPGLRMQPGMPAEVYIATPARSFLEYLTHPLNGFTARAMREP